MTEQFLQELIAWLDHSWWTIKEITSEIPDKCDKQETTKEVSWGYEYVYQRTHGIAADCYVGIIMIPIPNSDKFAKIKFEC